MMDGRESTFSGSPTNTGTDSPVSRVVPQVIDMAVNMSMERSIGSGGKKTEEKKKRGRPRKYGPDGNISFSLSSSSQSFPPSSEFSPNKPKGRTLASGNRHLLPSLGEWVANSAGTNFTPHILTINTGEDVATKIFSFSQTGSRSICVLSANGSVSNVTIRQSSSCGGLLTYEGRFEILSLTGSFSFADIGGGVRSRTGGLSVSLAGPDGRVVGGGVAGLLTAASPIQVVVGSFVPNTQKVQKKKRYVAPSVASTVPSSNEVVTTARPISQATPNGDNIASPTSTLPEQNNQVEAEENSASSNHNLNSTSFERVGWQAGSNATSHHKPSPDINVRLPGE